MSRFLYHVSEGAKPEEAAAEEAEEEPMEDLLKPGHLTKLLEEGLAAEVEALCVGDVSGGLERLLSRLKTHRDTSQPPQLQVPRTAAHVTSRTLYCPAAFRKEPMIGVSYSALFMFILILTNPHSYAHIMLARSNLLLQTHLQN